MGFISWALNDADAEVRRMHLRRSSLSKKEPRIAIMLTERAILDSDEKVRNNALRHPFNGYGRFTCS